jgi:indolepyruvate ferredoxin oxidoreductase, beta subunit
MKSLNIYCLGVGGQGIGLLSSSLSQACINAGHNVRGCDTHGLAQRGGTVVSHIRLGDNIFTPLVPEGEAGLVVGLERLEAIRGAQEMLCPGGTVVYYDTQYQPIHVRMRQAEYPRASALSEIAKNRNGHVARVYFDDLPDPRFQNVALLGYIAGLGLIEGMTSDILKDVVEQSVPKNALKKNLEVFDRACNLARKNG